MTKFRTEKISDHDFKVYHAVYSQENIFMSYDWLERLEVAEPDGCGFLLKRDGVAVGGVVFRDGHMTSPFLIPPFCDKDEFWRGLLELWKVPGETLFFDFIPESYCAFLEKAGGRKMRGQCRMLRPTTKENAVLNKDYYFFEPAESDKKEITEVVYESHLHGYTSTVTGPTDRKKTEIAVDRRFTAFSETGSLHFGTIVRTCDSHKIVAVCLAGIYPDACDNFSTIHQVSVLPEHRRKGVAEAMIRNTINTAYQHSPVISLGVMAGNPAKKLYSKIGFISGMEYNDYEL